MVTPRAGVVTPRTGDDPRRGAALLVVLLFGAFVSALAAAATRTGLSGARAAAVFADGVRADELGRGAADALAFRLATGDAAARRGGAIGLRLPGADVTIDYLSESARIDANAAPVSLLALLLGAVGAEPPEVEAVAARIARFRADAAARATPGAPAGAIGPGTAPPAGATTASIRDLSEVAAAWGLSDALARGVLPSLTVSGGAATVDPVLAGRTVLAAMLGSDERVDDYIRRRREGFESRESALALLPVPSRRFAGFTDAAAVRAVARVRVAGRTERRYEFVLAPSREAPQRIAAGGSAAAAPPPPSRPGTPVVVSWRVLP